MSNYKFNDWFLKKQLEAIDSVIADYGFNNFEGYYKP